MMRILIAEDDELVCTILQTIVEGFGHQCVAVPDGQAAWDHLVAQGADVVITDWKMPRMNGLELCRRTRASTQVAQPYFILLTATAEERQVVEARRAGMDDHLGKPPDIDELHARLSAVEHGRNGQALEPRP